MPFYRPGTCMSSGYTTHRVDTLWGMGVSWQLLTHRTAPIIKDLFIHLNAYLSTVTFLNVLMQITPLRIFVSLSQHFILPFSSSALQVPVPRQEPFIHISIKKTKGKKYWRQHATIYLLETVKSEDLEGAFAKASLMVGRWNPQVLYFPMKVPWYLQVMQISLHRWKWANMCWFKVLVQNNALTSTLKKA